MNVVMDLGDSGELMPLTAFAELDTMIGNISIATWPVSWSW
jgi:hypothetical protein